MAKTYDVLCMGRASLDLFAQEMGVPFEQVNGFAAYVGGCPTNICVGARRLGLKTALLTGVGDDHIAGLIRRFLAQEGITTDYVLVKPGYQTNTVLVAIQPPEYMQWVAYQHQNADFQLTTADILAAPIGDSRVLVFSGLGLLQEPSRSATQLAAELARSADTLVVMDLDYRAGMWPNPQVFGITARVTLPLVDVVLGTESEIQAAAGLDTVAAAVPALLERVQQAVIVKQGVKGAAVYTKPGLVIEVPAYPAEVVNFLGAGDAFASGLIYGYLQGWDWEEAARLGNACGAWVVARPGCANAMPTLDEVRALIDLHGSL